MEKKIYLDNAATTPLDPEVFEAMKPFMLEHFGNPSSIHGHGRKVRAAIEKARKTVAELINAAPSEIFFTSGGTEADNTALRGAIETLDIRHVITSPLEHHAVLHTMEYMEKQGQIKLSILPVDAQGVIDLNALEDLLKKEGRSVISIMHANNEIGNLTDIKKVSELAEEYDSIFHSDTVQTMGHYRHDVRDLNLHSLAAAGHKFHGPKGCGFLFLRQGHQVHPFIHGGAQERNMRGGTENVYGIIGLAKALEMAYEHMDEHQQHIQGLKDRMIAQLREQIPDITFNGLSNQADKSLYTVLNVRLPKAFDPEMLLFNLDIQGISASGGSACSSGSNIGSHVLGAMEVPADLASIRFSFSKYNTADEVDYTVAKLKEIMQEQPIL